MPVDLDAIRAGLARVAPPSTDYDLNPGFVMPEGRVLRPAGVLVAFQDGPEGLRLLLTKRSSRLRHPPGQIALPGGQVDPGDADAVAAARREAEEEVALPRDAVTVLGTLPAHETVTAFQVTPVVAIITRDFTPRAEAGEVEEVFTVPAAHVLDPVRYSIQARRWRGQRRLYFTVPWGPYYIWGATARILKGLADRVSA
jgi:8-oxo-dGTP pyrophosphatase MutT (NUDIX family)